MSTSTTPSPKLSLLNYLNVVAYIANIVITYGIGVAGFAGTPTNGDLSEKYQTIVTPIGWAFSIWGIIFIAQAIFAVVQLFPSFRAKSLVISGVGYNYVAVCIAQIAWTLSFTFEVIWLSLISMLSILFFLVRLVHQQYIVTEKTSVLDYLFLKFPFAVHCGWISAASLVNISVTLVKYNASGMAQYAVGLTSIVALFLVAVFCLYYPSRSEYIVPLVLSWASIGIYVELGTPKALVLATFSQNQIDAVRLGSLIASLTIAILVVVTAMVKVLIACLKERQETKDKEHAVDDPTSEMQP